MASIQVYRFPEGKVEQRDADVASLGKRPHRRVMREAAIMYDANRRAGTHSTKTRAEVNYTNKKPWAQKHTGRARAGTRRSPLWRGGGIIHGPHPRDYSYAMPRKALRAAVRSALLGKFLDDEVAALDGVALDAPNTKTVASALKALGVEGRALLVTAARDENFYKSARNIDGATVRIAAEVNAFDLLANRNLVLVNGALEALLKATGASAGEGPAAAPAKTRKAVGTKKAAKPVGDAPAKATKPAKAAKAPKAPKAPKPPKSGGGESRKEKKS
jgi:large subunit ribosomal protein L4